MAVPRQKPGTFTYADYLQWPEDERWELIDGVAYDMSPAPGRTHQRILGALYRRISDVTDLSRCETYMAPFDVRFPEHDAASEEEITTVVQPDISVFCRPERLDERGGRGAPDLVVEILSPSTGYKDQTEKLGLYERHRVREYWIVNPEAGYVIVFRLEEDSPGARYGKPDYYRRGEEIESRVLNGAIPFD